MAFLMLRTGKWYAQVALNTKEIRLDTKVMRKLRLQYF